MDYLPKNWYFAIIFTSGTTGVNKGVMLSHRNITTGIHSALPMLVEHLYKNIWKKAERTGQAARLKLGLIIQTDRTCYGPGCGV